MDARPSRSASISAWTLAAIVFLIAALLSGLVIRYEQRHRFDAGRAEVNEIAQNQAEALRRTLEHDLSVTSALAALVRQGRGRIQDFEATAGELLVFYPGVALLYLAPGGVIRQAAPPVGQESILGQDLLQDAGQTSEYFVPMASGTLALTGPVEMAPLGTVVVGHLPVYLDAAEPGGERSFWGFVSAVVGLPGILDAAHLAALAERQYDYRLWRVHPVTNRRLTIAESTSAPLELPVEVAQEIAGATWILSVAPRAGWYLPGNLILESLLGLAFSLLLASLAKLLIEAREDERRLARLVDLRTAELRAREEDLHRAQSVAGIGSWTHDFRRDRSWISVETCRIHGLPEDTSLTLRHKDFMAIVHEDDRANLERAWQSALRDATPYEIEHRAWIDGEIRWLHQRADIERAADGTPIRAVGTVQDVTEWRRTQAVLERERALLHQAERIAGVGYWTWDVEGDRLECSAQWLAIHGFETHPAPRSMAEFQDLVHPEDLEDVRQALRRIFDAASEDPWFYDVEHRIRRRSDNEIRCVHSRGELIRDARGRALRIHGVTQDISHRKMAERDLRLASIAFEAQEAMLVTDAAERILRVNRAFARMTGYAESELIGQTPKLFRSGHHDAAFYARMKEELANQDYWEGEVQDRRKNGEIFPAWLTLTAVRDEHERLTHYFATLNDISERKRAEEEIRQLAFYDPLTQLPNRRLLLDRLRHALAASQRSQRQGAVLFIDLDNFKTLNDRHGHAVGDLLLKQVAERLTACVRAGDTVSRLGGDEFVVLLVDLDPDAGVAVTQAMQVGDKILASLNRDYLLEGLRHRTTPSIGVALFGGYRRDAEALLDRADQAMYQAKAAGRNTLRFFDPVAA